MSGILGYFDLSKRISATHIEILPDTSREFAAPSKSVKTVPISRQVTLYLGTVVGVLFSSAIMQFQVGKLGALNITVTAVILSAIIALIIMPNIYEKAVKPNAPFIVQLGLFVQQGVFWSVLLTSIGKTLG
jgi:hypothetical protein